MPAENGKIQRSCLRWETLTSTDKQSQLKLQDLRQQNLVPAVTAAHIHDYEDGVCTCKGLMWQLVEVVLQNGMCNKHYFISFSSTTPGAPGAPGGVCVRVLRINNCPIWTRINNLAKPFSILSQPNSGPGRSCGPW